MNNVLENDIRIVSENQNLFSELNDCNILVTGATGLLGSLLIKSILTFANNHFKKIRVYASCRNKEKFNDVFTEYKSEMLIPIFSDVVNINISDLSLDYVIHGASVTDSKTFVEKPVETIEIAVDGTRKLLNQLKGKSIKAFVYLSSLEVYGTFNSDDGIKNVTEDDSGYIDTMSVRSSYSESKRLVETICKSYYSEFDIPIKVVRLCQTFGAGVEYSDNRVFAQFARSVIEGKNIVLKTKGETVRNYCYTTDAVSGILTVLLKGNSGEAYNIANSATTCSISEMADLFCSLYPHSGTNVVYDINEDVVKLGYNPVVKLELNTNKLQQLGWKADVSLSEMITRLIESMKELR